MIYIKSFKNYEGFKNVFGIRECGNGNKARMNKILLGCLKNRAFFHLAVTDTDYDGILSINNMADFKKWLYQNISDSSIQNYGYWGCVSIDGSSFQFIHPNLEMDNDGICFDGDTGAIRYVNHENNDRVFKMKAGKFLTKIIESCEFGRNLPQQAKSWLGEEFKTAWQAYAEKFINKYVYEFHYGNDAEDFSEIYSSDHRRGNFESCMTDKGYDDMYANSAKCHAAWLTDEDGLMFARCIVWDEVYDEDTGEVLRLAERQYSDGVQDKYKKMLVDELIERKLIDGYKQIGASCHDNRNFVLNDGTSIRDHDLHIELNIDWGDHVSYMDSFKYYDKTNYIAYNYDADCNYLQELDTTDGYMEDDDCCHDGEVYSEYYDEYIDEDEAVYIEREQDWYYGRDCVEDHNGNWQLADDCVTCDECGDYVLQDDAYQLDDFDDRYFCDEDCAERWLDSNGYTWDDYNECYTNEDTYCVNILLSYGWVREDMRESTFNDFDFEGEIHEFDGEYYLTNDDKSKEAYKNMTLPALVVA